MNRPTPRPASVVRDEVLRLLEIVTLKSSRISEGAITAIGTRRSIRP